MPYSLFCAVIGGETLSTVKIKGTQTVGELKNKIKSTAGLVSAAHSLTLYHVDLDIASDGAYLHAMRTISRSTTCAQVIHDLLPNTADPKQEELINPSHELSAIFSPAPARHRIHILVQLPPGGLTWEQRTRMEEEANLVDEGPPCRVSPQSSSPLILPPHLALRDETVLELVQILHEGRLVQVRGGPGSGKTTLKHLVHRSLQRYYPSAVIYKLNEWDRVPGTTLRERFALYAPGFNHDDDHGKDHFLLVDDAEQTYSDGTFWIWLKDFCQSGLLRYRAILFCQDAYSTSTTDEPIVAPRIPRNCKVELEQGLHTYTPGV